MAADRECGRNRDRDHWLRVKELLGHALELPPDARPAYLDTECGGEDALRAEIEGLLDSADDATAFLEAPAIPASMLADDPGLDLAPGDHVGPYEILEPLGEGGFAMVFGAQQEEPIKRRVALKLIKPGMDSRQIAQRFEAERAALALMDHPHIARVLDAGTTEQGRPYVVMEWVEGLPFSDYCDEHLLDIRERLELFLQVCGALEHAHQKGIVHRDIKPSNVLVEHRPASRDGGHRPSLRDGGNRDGEHSVKVIDFGIAKALQSSNEGQSMMTQTGMFLGTPEYMSPEQAGFGDADVDTRADVYALGVLLYEILTGVRPFTRETLRRTALDEVLRMIREVDPPRPSTRIDPTTENAAEHAAERRQVRPEELCRSLRGDLDWIVMKALEKDRERRYSSVSVFADDVRRHLNHEPVSAGPPLLRYRLRKFARRNRALFAGMSIAVAALITGIVVASVGFFQARAAEEVARIAEHEARTAETEARAAEKEERAARQNAETALREAESVGTFLADLLSSVRADEKGKDVKVRELLDNADFTELDSPLVEARLRDVVGNSYRSLGVLDRASEELQAALAIAEKLVGPDDVRTLSLQLSILLVRSDATQEDGLLEASKSLMDRAMRVLGPEDPETLKIRNAYASFLLQIGRQLDESIRLMEELLPLYDRVIGPKAGVTLSLIGNLSLAYTFKARRVSAEEAKIQFANAEKYGQMHVDRATAERDPDHPRAMFAARAMAVVLFQQRKFQPALDILQPLAKRMARVYGEDHIHTLGVENYIGFALQNAGKFDAATKLYERIIPLQDKTLGPGHRQSMMALHNLGMLLFSQKKNVEAEKILREALVRYEKYRSVDHYETAVARFHLGEVILATDRPVEALPLLEPAVEHLVKSVGWQHRFTREAGTAYVRALNFASRAQFEAGDKRGAAKTLEKAWNVAKPLNNKQGSQGLAGQLADVYEELGEKDAAATWRARAKE